MTLFTLAIETSHARGSVAVWKEGGLVFEESFSSERSHNSQLFEPLGRALTSCVGGLSRIVVGLGPGSYTGARIGIAAAQAIAMSMEVPVVGLPSVLAVEPTACIVCGDARRGRFFTVEVRDGRQVDELAQHDAAEIARLRAERTDLPWLTFDARSPASLPDVATTVPQAGILARLGAALPDESVFQLEERALEPVYLAAPFVTVPKR